MVLCNVRFIVRHQKLMYDLRTANVSVIGNVMDQLETLYMGSCFKNDSSLSEAGSRFWSEAPPTDHLLHCQMVVLPGGLMCFANERIMVISICLMLIPICCSH